MNTFKFNTIYIVESLKEDEPKTGSMLYEKLKPLEQIHDQLSIVFCEVQSKQEWIDLMDNILEDCATKGVYPIIHLEIHGCETGIVFSNGEYILVDEINEQFRKINLASGCNLFITLGVCEGLYVLFGVRIDQLMPYCGAVGSFDDLWNRDIKLRYAEFYDAFFRTFNIYEAYKSLMTIDTGFEPRYRYIPVDEIFYKCYQDYIEKGCSKEAVKQRAVDSLPIVDCLSQIEVEKDNLNEILLNLKRKKEYLSISKQQRTSLR